MKQIQKTIFELMVYINLNLFEQLLLDDLAEKFCYSKYYLHREFRKTVGMTINSYINQKRIENSIYYMFADIDSSLTEIACCCGFTSAAFSREFKRVFGRTPKEWRNIYKKNLNENSKICKNYQRFLCYSDNGAPEEIKQITRTEINEREVFAGIFYGNYYSEDFHCFFRNIIKMNRLGLPVIGIPLNSPSVTDREHCLYLLGYENNTGNELLSRFTVSGGSYVKISFEGARNRIGEVYTWLFKYYLPKNGLKYSCGTMIQEYRGDLLSEKADMVLYIPVKL